MRPRHVAVPVVRRRLVHAAALVFFTFFFLVTLRGDQDYLGFLGSFRVLVFVLVLVTIGGDLVRALVIQRRAIPGLLMDATGITIGTTLRVRRFTWDAVADIAARKAQIRIRPRSGRLVRVDCDLLDGGQISPRDLAQELAGVATTFMAEGRG